MDDRSGLELFTNKHTRRHTILRGVMACSGLALWSAEARAQAEHEISHSAESIDQEVSFKAGPKRVYEALTTARQFDSVVKLSAAMKSRELGDKPTEIINQEGGAFVLFGHTAWAGRSNFCRTSESYKPGGWAAGNRASIRLQDSSSPGKGRRPRSFLTTPASPRGWENTWRPVGKVTTGNRSKIPGLSAPARPRSHSEGAAIACIKGRHGINFNP